MNKSGANTNADDVPRAKTFYEKSFGWQFTAWGPPDFYLIQTGTAEDRGLHGALQGRREIVKGKPMSKHAGLRLEFAPQLLLKCCPPLLLLLVRKIGG